MNRERVQRRAGCQPAWRARQRERFLPSALTTEAGRMPALRYRRPDAEAARAEARAVRFLPQFISVWILPKVTGGRTRRPASRVLIPERAERARSCIVFGHGIGSRAVVALFAVFGEVQADGFDFFIRAK